MLIFSQSETLSISVEDWFSLLWKDTTLYEGIHKDLGVVDVSFLPWEPVNPPDELKSARRLVTFQKAFQGSDFLRKLVGLGRSTLIVCTEEQNAEWKSDGSILIKCKTSVLNLAWAQQLRVEGQWKAEVCTNQKTRTTVAWEVEYLGGIIGAKGYSSINIFFTLDHRQKMSLIKTCFLKNNNSSGVIEKQMFRDSERFCKRYFEKAHKFLAKKKNISQDTSQSVDYQYGGLEVISRTEIHFAHPDANSIADGSTDGANHPSSQASSPAVQPLNDTCNINLEGIEISAIEYDMQISNSQRNGACFGNPQVKTIFQSGIEDALRISLTGVGIEEIALNSVDFENTTSFSLVSEGASVSSLSQESSPASTPTMSSRTLIDEDFMNSEINTIAVLGYTNVSKNQNESAIVYTIELSNNNSTWTLQRRFSELWSSHCQLQRIHQLPEFPQKKFFNQMDPDFLEKRKVELEAYFQSAIQKTRPVGVSKTGLLIRLLEMDDIHDAVAKKDLELVRCILSHCEGALLARKQNSLGETPLHIASVAGSTDIAELVIKYGPDVNSKDRVECSPLTYAASTGMTSVAKLLIQNGAVVDILDCNGNTPLQIACFNGNVELTQYLVNEGADINSRNSSQESTFFTTARALSLIFKSSARDCGDAFVLSQKIQAYVDIMFILLDKGVDTKDLLLFNPLLLAKAVCQSCPEIHERWVKEITRLELSIRSAAYHSDIQNLLQTVYTRNESMANDDIIEKTEEPDCQSRKSPVNLVDQNCKLIDRFLGSEMERLQSKMRELIENSIQRIQNQTLIDSVADSNAIESSNIQTSINDESGYFAPAGTSLKFDTQVLCMKMSQNGETFMTLSFSDGSISLFKVAQKGVSIQLVHEKRVPWGCITELDWSWTHPKIYGICGSKICSIETSNFEMKLECDVGAGLGLVKCHPLMNNFLIVGSNQNIIMSIDIENGKVVQKSELVGSPKSICFDMSGSTMFVGDSKGLVYHIGLNSNDGRWKIKSKNTVSKGYPVTSLSFMPPCPSLGSRLPVLMTHSADNRVRIFNVILRPLFLLHPIVEYSVVCNRMYPSLSENIKVQSHFCQAPTTFGGKSFVVSGSENSSVYVYEVGKGTCTELPNHIHPVTQVAWSRQLNQLATLDTDNNILFWFYK